VPPRAFLPGWGASATLWEPFGTSVPVGPGVEIVGWSLGAMQALEAAMTIDVAGLVLVAGTPQFVRGGEWELGWSPRILQRMLRVLDTDPDGLLDDFERSMFVPGEERVPIPRETDPETLATGLHYLDEASLLDRLDEVRCPVRLLHGGADRLIPVAAAETLAAALPHADLTVWEEAGHAPHLTQPDRFRAWLDAT
jgi:pimeloyl-[acyl-carrier protein] methyl ester esterase